jgi:integrase
VKIPELLKDYFADNAGRFRSKNTVRTYGKYLAILHRDLGRHVGRYTESDLATWVQGAGRLAPATVSLRIRVARSFFGWAAWKGHIKTDPSANLTRLVSVHVKTVRPANWLTRPQVRAVIDGCPDTVIGRRDRVLLTLGFNTGLRVHEICNLRWADLDLGARRLTGIGKGEKPFTIGLTGALTETLEKWQADSSAAGAHSPVLPTTHRQWESGERSWEDELVVRWEEPLGINGARSAVARAGQRAGIQALAPHDMRRTLAGILDADGVPITEIRDVLRHSSVATTERYLQSSPHRAVGRLQGFEL